MVTLFVSSSSLSFPTARSSASPFHDISPAQILLHHALVHSSIHAVLPFPSPAPRASTPSPAPALPRSVPCASWAWADPRSSEDERRCMYRPRDKTRQGRRGRGVDGHAAWHKVDPAHRNHARNVRMGEGGPASGRAGTGSHRRWDSNQSVKSSGTRAFGGDCTRADTRTSGPFYTVP